MNDYNEKDVSDSESILEFVASIGTQETELVLSSSNNTVGAILTAKQYEWFLDQLDAQQDIDSISKRSSDLDGSQSLDDFKKDLD